MAQAAESRRPGSLLLLPGFALRAFRASHVAPTQSLIPGTPFHIGRASELVVVSDRGWNFVRARPRQCNTNCVGIGRIARCIIVTSSNVRFVGKKGVITRI